MKPHWDIFCVVVDNYGDIGVTWRLARQLQAEHDVQVRLWVDDLQPFARLCPDTDPHADQQFHHGVQVRRWPAEWEATEVADVVIGAFACKLPPPYIDAMAARARPCLWLNLEYLSAEDWVVGCHALPSLQSNRLQKFFFFPGFVPGTGGLLRESGLLAQRDALQGDREAQREFLARLGVERQPEAHLVSLFAYENAAVAEWLDAMATGLGATQLLVPEGRVLDDVRRWLGAEWLEAGDLHVRGQLTINVLPFISQDQYDRLLWCCDFNAVRGEDSFIRAQWAARPMLWHIYPQEEDAHIVKLDAWLHLYTRALSPQAADALRGLMHAWSRGEGMGLAWPVLCLHRVELRLQAEQWCANLAVQPDLAAALVQFYRNWI
ncbi:elongation factor P maturation arginine rhamnosyltransferase EarP [Pseudomonas sp. dw_358]|uniref:elongation factor P maturation arginine rhamnosyltransferase EarP n=1 Tax=Pseudomonas sp. dw_358 TaxID=2720083 RepID=UPI001BD1D64C|nr:elongation factor P maturation arginine rhamnosyltransferase EarP [Pseudomonas sp. dw_358]